jgi:hypothetical protein
MTVAQMRANDPAIQRALQFLASVNIQNPEFDTIKKILI